jgi:hypothetical protein
MESLDFTTDELRAERSRLMKLAHLCKETGEVDGAVAAESQLRAVESRMRDGGLLD